MAQMSQNDSFGVVLLAATALSHPAHDVKVCKLVSTNEKIQHAPMSRLVWAHLPAATTAPPSVFVASLVPKICITYGIEPIVQVSRLRGDHWQLWKSMEEEQHFSKPDRQNPPH
jgi:hypothetical protein